MDATERAELVAYLRDLGATDDDIAALDDADLPRLPFELRLWPEREHLTMQEVAQRAGVDPSFVARAWRASGFAQPAGNDRVFVTDDVDLLQLMAAAVDRFGEDVVWQLSRVFGTAAAHLADAAVSTFVVSIGPAALEAGGGPVALARANTQAADFIPGLLHGFEIVMRHHLGAARRPASAMTVGADVLHRAVGFVDLVDSTGLAEQLSMTELSDALGSFDAAATESIARHGGRIVKLLGDGVMFIASEPAIAVDIALDLVDEFDDHAVLPQVRAAVATGEVIARDGDFYGVVVNRAARAVGAARRSSLLVDDDTVAALAPERFRVKPVGEFRLRHIAERVRLHRVRRA